MAPELEVQGLPELLRKLRGLPDQVRAKVIKGAVASGAAVIKNEAISRAPIYSGKVGKNHPPPGALKAAIYQARLLKECTGTVEAWLVSVRKGPRAAASVRGNVDAYYATWVEYGTVKMGAKPFMRPAFEAKKNEAVEAMRQYVLAKLPDALKG